MIKATLSAFAINLSAINAPVSEDRDVITGTLAGSSVKVFRRANGFVVELGVEVDGVLVHLAPPMESEKAAYVALLERAFSDRSFHHDEKKSAAVRTGAFKALFGTK